MGEVEQEGGLKLASLRKERNVKQVEMAKALGITQTHLSRIERGHRNMTLDLMQKAAARLGVSVSYFLGEDREPAAVTGRIVEVDESKRAIICPNCGNEKFSDRARYCPKCRYPLFNFCVAQARHTNDPSAIYCEICSERTFWHLSEEEWSTEKIQSDYHILRTRPVESERM